LLKAQRLLQTAYTRGGIAYRYEEDESEKKAEQLGKSFEEAREAMRLYKEVNTLIDNKTTRIRCCNEICICGFFAHIS